ncbi:amino acid permease [Isobaculum melis]|uniref:Amino acid/polyamine/organocation transporter, APC superfamily n=1 Tax=Isobaculum melis TaxID=142588 RepID=A0A1H9SQ70_9LACT|nr:amino acid permease [Isobaculum melis]SER87081.1 amino acid/polyamine/organocation transporter, APC superfamily [Isobaculum melis]
MSYFRKKPIDPNAHQNSVLKKELGAMDLILLGIGAIVGTGIFVITGTAAAETAGPALSLSFIMAGFACVLSALCFAEFASRMPISGGAYSYAYSTFGELIGWITGWLMICEYTLANASVASGWSGYVHGLLNGLGIHFPKALTASYNAENGTYIDILAVLVMFVVAYLVTQGAKKVLRLNNVMVVVKFAIIFLFIIVGVFYVKPANWTPFAPMGFSGITTGAAIVFFAFLGFDAVSMAAEEVKKPQRDLPIGIIGSLSIATVLYVVVTLILTGIVPFAELNVKDPVAYAMRFIGQNQVSGIISIGAIVTLITVLIAMIYGEARMIFAISRDGLLPKKLSKVNPKTQTPSNATFVVGAVAGILSGVVPLERLAQLTNIVTLMLFSIICIGVILLRRDMGQPSKDEFRVPLVPFLPILGAAVSIYLMLQLSATTWQIFILWLAIGLLVYAYYGYKHSHLNGKK